MSYASSPHELLTLELLLSRAATGDAGAFTELYERASPRLLGVCLRMLQDPLDAEEVLQEVFVTVWRSTQLFDPTIATATTWLVALTRNKAIDRLRQRRTPGVLEAIDPEHLVDERWGPPAHAEADQQYRRLQACLDRLEPRHSQALRDAFFRGATYKELAERSEVPLGTMKSWIRRALAELRVSLET